MKFGWRNGPQLVWLSSAFRYEIVTDLYVGAHAAGYKELVERVYGHSPGIARAAHK